MFKIESSLMTTELKASNIRKNHKTTNSNDGYVSRLKTTHSNISQCTELQAHNLHHNNQYH